MAQELITVLAFFATMLACIYCLLYPFCYIVSIYGVDTVTLSTVFAVYAKYSALAALAYGAVLKLEDKL